MRQRLREWARHVQWRVHAFAAGMTLALAAPLLGSSCAASGA